MAATKNDRGERGGVSPPVCSRYHRGADAEITVATRVGRGENPEEKTLPVAKDARIVLDGNESKLADIKVFDNGPFAMLRLSLDQKSVQAIQTGQGR